MNTAAIEVIRHSLNAASAALALLDTTRPVVENTLVENTVVEIAQVPNPEDELFDKLMKELDGDYNLRTVSELVSTLGVSRMTIENLLVENDISYVTKLRRSDNAPLIGLDSRN